LLWSLFSIIIWKSLISAGCLLWLLMLFSGMLAFCGGFKKEGTCSWWWFGPLGSMGTEETRSLFDWRRWPQKGIYFLVLSISSVNIFVSMFKDWNFQPYRIFFVKKFRLKVTTEWLRQPPFSFIWPSYIFY
jgi:hypothetical protein